MIQNITVIGSTGMIGTPVTKELINAGFSVTLLVRDIEKAKKIFGDSVSYVSGDLEDRDSIAEAIKNADGLYINISTRPTDKENIFNPEIHGLDKILEVAAHAKNLKQIAYLSSFLARNYQGDWWVFRAKKSSIERIKLSGIPYTIFYPSNFMENFKFGMVRNGKISILKTKTENKAWWIAGEDFGRQVANAFKNELALNREYPVQGPEGLTMKEAAERFVNAYTKEKLTVGYMPFILIKILALFLPVMKYLSRLMSVMLNNVETFESQNTWNELGKPELTIEKFAIKNS